jgi:hypothetical protein
MSTETAPSPALDLSLLTGTWINTNTESRGIHRVVVKPHGRGLAVAAYGPDDWGTVEAAVFADAFESRTAMAFSTWYQFDFMDVRLQANVKNGVLVMASLNRFTDDSGRSSYFTREFYYRREP